MTSFRLHYECSALPTELKGLKKVASCRSRTCASFYCSNQLSYFPIFNDKFCGEGGNRTHDTQSGDCFLANNQNLQVKLYMKTLYFSVKLHTIVLYRNTQQDKLDIVIPAKAGKYFKKRTGNTHAYGQTFVGLQPKLSLLFHVLSVALEITYLSDAINHCNCSATQTWLAQ